jgi:hypothetical protein
MSKRRRLNGKGMYDAVYRGTMLGLAAARKYKTAKSMTRTTTRQSNQGSEPLTGQFDYKTDYKKRRYGRKSRRAFKRRRKWSRKVVRTVRNANVGTTHIMRRSFGTIATLSQVSSRVGYGLNGLNGRLFGDFNSTDDLSAILKDIDPSSWASADTGAGQNHKLYVKHGTMELICRNTGTTDCILEFYYIRGSRATRRDTSPAEVYDQGFLRQADATDPNTGNPIGTAALSSATVGTTPFQSSLFCQHYNIYRRQKFRLPPGNEVNVVIHSGRPFTTNLDWVKNHSTDKRFHGILIQQQGVPTAPVGEGPTAYSGPCQVTYHAIRRYNFKMFRDNLPKDAFDAPNAIPP